MGGDGPRSVRELVQMGHVDLKSTLCWWNMAWQTGRARLAIHWRNSVLKSERTTTTTGVNYWDDDYDKLVGCCALTRARIGARRFTEPARFWDVSYTLFDVQKDDSFTGRGRVERRRRDLRLRLCDCVAVEQKFITDWSDENAAFTSWIILLVRSLDCVQLCCCLISKSVDI